MKAELLKIYADNPEGRKIAKVVEVLRAGGVIVYPTDTVYGLGCDLFQPKAIERICRIKGIDPRKNLLSFICKDVSQVSEYAKNLTTPLFKLINKSLPGPFTFIFVSTSKVPKTIDPKRKTVGIRIPDHQVPLSIVEGLGNPIITTSVHHEDKIIEYATDPEFIMDTLGDQVDLVIDSGLGGNVPSTVIDFTSGEAVVAREGLGDPAPFLA